MDTLPIITSPIKAFGGKYNAISNFGLIDYFPRDVSGKIFIETFCYSAVVTMNLPICYKKVVINDKDKYIYNFWNVIKNNLPEFEKELEFVWCSKDWVEEYSKREDPVGNAVWFYLKNRMSHSGIFELNKISNKFQISPLRKDLTKWKRRLDRFRSLTIMNTDFREIYDKLIKSVYNYVIYDDPPYYEQQQYFEEFSQQDFDDLFQFHQKIRDNPKITILISYNNHEWVRNHYSKENGWYSIEVSWQRVAGAWNNKTNPNKSTGNYHELLISNKPLVRYIPEKKLDNFMEG